MPLVYKCVCGYISVSGFVFLSPGDMRYASAKGCPRCGDSDTSKLVRMPEPTPWTITRRVKPGVPVALSDVATTARKHLPCDNRLFGSPLPFGSLTLVSGEPGCGKTTSLFDVCNSVHKGGGVALYVTSEEELSALKSKADAWNISPGVLVAEAKTVSEALGAIRRSKPDFFVIDSINDLVNDADTNRELVETTEAIRACVRKKRRAGVVIGHINKAGGVSGPETIEHAVDSVVFIEVEKSTKSEKREKEKERKKKAIPMDEAIDPSARRIVSVKKCRYGRDGIAGFYMLEETGITWLESRIPYVIGCDNP